MSLTETIKNNNLYLNIIGGTLMQKVNEGTPRAEKRDYEKPDGSTGSKWEIKHKNLTGKIVDIKFEDSDFGEQMRVKILNGSDYAILTIVVSSRYFIDFGKKISNIYLEDDITLNPYDFSGENDKRIQGLSIKQEGEKIQNYFWDVDKKKVLYGFPQPEGDSSSFDSDDWKMYFIKVKKFLKAHIESIEMLTKQEEVFEHTTDINQEDHDDLPF